MKAKLQDLIPFPLLLLKCHRCDKNEISDAKLFFLDGGFFLGYNSTVTLSYFQVNFILWQNALLRILGQTA